MSIQSVSAAEAYDLILKGNAPDGLSVNGHLNFTGNADLTALPDGLSVTRLTLVHCTNLKRFPARLACNELEMRQTPIGDLPDDLRVEYRLDLSEGAELEALPPGLKTGSLILRNCEGLRALPEGLTVNFLDISGCTHLTGWPRQGSLQFGRLVARDCAWLEALPTWITNLAQLDLNGCKNLHELPRGLRVSSWLDVTGTAIEELPVSLEGARVRLRTVLVNQRIAFHPETITAHEVLDESNAEVRRVMLECMGYDKFMAEAQAETLDQDSDPGGERLLLRVPISGDEALVCIAVKCPSTGRQYLIRVPPQMQRCHQAAAWIAGYDDPAQYNPLAET